MQSKHFKSDFDAPIEKPASSNGGKKEKKPTKPKN
jgi:hypothetical protein